MSMAPNRIKELRETREMTLETLADKVGLSPSYVQRLENGRRNLSVKHLDGFAQALGVKPRDLIDASDMDSKIIEAIRGAAPAKKAAVALLLGIDQPHQEEGQEPSASSRRQPAAKPK